MSTTNPGGTFIVAGKRYDVPEKFTLGDQRIFKHMGVMPDENGLIWFDFKNPDVLAALLRISMQHAGERVTEADIDAIEADVIEFEAPDIPAEVPADIPPAEAPAGAEASEAPTPESPNGATTPASSGAPA